MHLIETSPSTIRTREHRHASKIQTGLEENRSRSRVNSPTACHPRPNTRPISNSANSASVYHALGGVDASSIGACRLNSRNAFSTRRDDPPTSSKPPTTLPLLRLSHPAAFHLPKLSSRTPHRLAHERLRLPTAPISSHTKLYNDTTSDRRSKQSQVLTRAGFQTYPRERMMFSLRGMMWILHGQIVGKLPCP